MKLNRTQNPCLSCYYLRSTVPHQHEEASETACRPSDIRQVSAETNTNEILSGGLAVSQGSVTL